MPAPCTTLPTFGAMPPPPPGAGAGMGMGAGGGGGSGAGSAAVGVVNTMAQVPIYPYRGLYLSVSSPYLCHGAGAFPTPLPPPRRLKNTPPGVDF